MSPRGLVGKPLTFFFNKSDLPLLIEGYAFFFKFHNGRVGGLMAFVTPRKHIIVQSRLLPQ